MDHKQHILIAFILVVLLVLGAGGIAQAQIPHSPSADTYTDRNNTATTHGGDTGLLLSATNTTEGGCVQTTYLWYKFDVPTPRIDSAVLSLSFAPFALGTLDMELLSSADTSWSEADLNWSNQPALDGSVLATAASTPGGGTASFSGTALASYLSDHRGQTVTLVVRANCSGSVGVNAVRGVNSKENTNGSGASLEMFGPTAVRLQSFSAVSGDTSLWVTLLIAGIFLGGISLGVYLVRKTIKPANQ